MRFLKRNSLQTPCFGKTDGGSGQSRLGCSPHRFLSCFRTFDDLSVLVFHFRYYSLPHAPPTEAQAILLEYALCRFVKGSNSVSIDEPLVVLAYTRCIEPKLSQSLLYRQILNSPTSAAKGNWFEFFLLRPLLRLLSGVPLDKMDLPVVEKPTPKLFLDLFRDAVAASSSSSSIPMRSPLFYPGRSRSRASTLSTSPPASPRSTPPN